ncbi:MAG TPA: hypothetical protein VNW68_04145 [Candidatus Limnocylindria bacterium]|nr:hypothetical protein [Candidatus Limnocylindria bacterium]
MNIRRNLSAGVLVGALVFVAACGGTPPAGPAITPAAQSPGAPAGTPAQPAATPAAQPGAGHDVQDPCGLATIDEVSAALGVDAVTAERGRL